MSVPLKGKLNIAVDIGTSTISACVSPSDGSFSGSLSDDSRTIINSSKRFGADIISRMESAVNGDLSKIAEMIRSDVRALILSMADAEASEGTIMISCNTGLLHLFNAVFPDGLLHYPFTPNILSVDTVSADYYFGREFRRFTVSFVPCISSFVGGDIVSGLIASSFDVSKEIDLLVDMGTNAEIAIGNSELIYVSSTAAGPAFEGGNMECGTSYVRGALTGVGEVYVCDGFISFKEVRINGYDTYHDVGPDSELPCIGICGSGYFELISRLLECGVLEPNGSFNDEYCRCISEGSGGPLGRNIVICKGTFGSVYISLADIRNFLLAKASVQAGVECLMLRYGVCADEIGRVFIGGAFGRAFGVNDRVLPLPKSLCSKVVTCGNTSLMGACMMLNDSSKVIAANKIVSVSKLFELAGNEVFQNKYFEAMTF